MNNDERAPEAKLVFTKGSYQQALRDYDACKEIALDFGLALGNDFFGKIHSPLFRGEAIKGGIVKDVIIDIPEWNAQMDIWIMLEPAICRDRAIQHLKQIKLPDNAHWEFHPSVAA